MLLYLVAAFMLVCGSWLLLAPCVQSAIRHREHARGAKALVSDSPFISSLHDDDPSLG